MASASASVVAFLCWKELSQNSLFDVADKSASVSRTFQVFDVNFGRYIWSIAVGVHLRRLKFNPVEAVGPSRAGDLPGRLRCSRVISNSADWFSGKRAWRKVGISSHSNAVTNSEHVTHYRDFPRHAMVGSVREQRMHVRGHLGTPFPYLHQRGGMIEPTTAKCELDHGHDRSTGRGSSPRSSPQASQRSP
jgi:hypothetical protein